MHVAQMSRPGAYEKRNVEVCNDCHHMKSNKERTSIFTCISHSRQSQELTPEICRCNVWPQVPQYGKKALKIHSQQA